MHRASCCSYKLPSVHTGLGSDEGYAATGLKPGLADEHERINELHETIVKLEFKSCFELSADLVVVRCTNKDTSALTGNLVSTTRSDFPKEEVDHPFPDF